MKTMIYKKTSDKYLKRHKIFRRLSLEWYGMAHL